MHSVRQEALLLRAAPGRGGALDGGRGHQADVTGQVREMLRAVTAILVCSALVISLSILAGMMIGYHMAPLTPPTP